MPALQVREFPEDLYDRLRASAERGRRSIAQQTIVAVEQMLAREAATGASVNSEPGWEDAALSRAWPSFGGPGYCRPDADCGRDVRIAKRERLFRESDGLRWSGDDPSAEEIVRMVREGRDDRAGRIIGACDAGEPACGSGSRA